MLWLLSFVFHLLLVAAARLCLQSIMSVTYCLQISHICGHYEYNGNSGSIHGVSEINRTTFNPIQFVTIPTRRVPRTAVPPKRNWRRIFRNSEYRKSTIPMSNEKNIKTQEFSRYQKQTEARRDDGGMAEIAGRTEPTIYFRQRFTPPASKGAKMSRTAAYRLPVEDQCDHYSNHCMKAYNTGIVCGRTLFARYHTFISYCMLDYVNCMERYESWQLAHLGPCFNFTPYKEKFYTMLNDYWLDQNIQHEEVKPF